ncbi:MAG TPA: AAA family ATPase, partial [Gemmataceae bacterium]|nr:AAA family ATPase [Gemmataceae bacterium]
MARKRTKTDEAPSEIVGDDPAAELQRPPAEVLYAAELAKLAEADAEQPRPKGWKRSPRSVVTFVLGDDNLGIAPKFVGQRSFVERCIVALATNRGLMLIGEPGTAKSWLSELLAAAICGDSTLAIQGSAGTTEDAIKYSWNYALLLAEGPSERSLVPAPLYRGMKDGKIVRFEELTRCPLEMQDILLSILSDRVMAIPELHDDARTLFARTGFNVIATANTRDRGVNEMSAALKRRFNFETVHPIADLQEEMA